MQSSFTCYPIKAFSNKQCAEYNRYICGCGLWTFLCGWIRNVFSTTWFYKKSFSNDTWKLINLLLLHIYLLFLVYSNSISISQTLKTPFRLFSQSQVAVASHTVIPSGNLWGLRSFLFTALEKRKSKLKKTNEWKQWVEMLNVKWVLTQEITYLILKSADKNTPLKTCLS